MRILHVTDTHLGVIRPVRGSPRGWSRARDHLGALRAALADGEARGVDLIVHSGDLFDRSRPPARAVVEGEALLREAARRVPVLLMPGNHDRRGLRRWVPHPSITVCDRPERVVVRGVAFGLVPFQRTAEEFGAAIRSLGGVDLLVAHQAFDGAWVPGFTFRLGRPDVVGEPHLPAGVRHILCGHLHPRQVTRVGGVEVVQPGSTERTAWSERAQPKGWAIWELDRETTWTFVDGPARPMIDVARAEHLDRVVPDALVRCPPSLERDVLARGGWLDGPPKVAGGPRPARAEPGPVGQLGLF